MPAEQVVVEFVADTSGLQPAVDRLQQMGEVDAQSAAIFKATNEQIKTRNQLISAGLANTDQLSASVNEQQAIYNKLVASVKNLSGASKDAVQQLLQLSAGDIAQGFKEAAVNVDDYISVLQNAGKSQQDFDSNSVQTTTRLNEIKNALAALGPITAENQAQFEALAAEGGRLQESLNQSRGVIRSLGSESPVLTAFTNTVSGLAGAFQAGAAAATLFGDESKDLQAVLVKVFQITSIVQGVQQTLNAVNQKGTLTVLQLAIANRAAALNTQLLTAAQSENIIVSKAATIAQGLLNSVMEANPVSLLATGLVVAVSALAAYAEAASKAKDEENKLNDALADNILLNEHIQNLNNNSDQFIASLKARNAKESELTQEQADNLRKIIKERQDKIDADQKLLDDARTKRQEDANKAVAAASGGSITIATDIIPPPASEVALVKQIQDNFLKNEQDWQKLLLTDTAQVKVNADEQLQIARDLASAELETKIQGSKAFFAAERLQNNAQLAQDLKDAGDNEGKIALVKANAAKRLRDINAAERAQAAEDEINVETAALLNIQTKTREVNTQISREETAQQIQLINTRSDAQIIALQKQADQDVTFQKTANDKIAVINAQRIQQTEQLLRDQQNREAKLLEDNEIARRNIILAGTQATNAERLKLEIENDESEKNIALLNTSLTEEQRLAIIAQSQEKERQLRNQFIQQQADDQIALNTEVAARENTELQRQLDAQKQIRESSNPKQTAQLLDVPILNLDQQKQAIQDLTDFQLQQNAILIKANDDKNQSEEEFSKADAKLVADRVAIRQKGAEAEQQLIKDTADFQKKMNQAVLSDALSGVAQGLQILSNYYQQQDQAAEDRLQRQKQNVQDELDAGVITAKAAAERNKELDAQDRLLKQQQARRNKEIAIFQAIIGTATAVIQALDAPPPLSFISAAIAGALGAAQIAVIASQPLPQFKMGKNERDNYEGWGEIGEAGPELWKSGSQMKLAEKSSIVWLKKTDTVYTPKQTAAIMNTKIPVEVKKVNQAIPFDYNKLADAVTSKKPIVLSIDGYKEFIKTERNFTTELSKRRKWQ